MRTRKPILALLATAVLAVLLTGIAYAGVRIEGIDWSLPAYERSLGFWPSEEWFVVAFWRPPTCISPTWDLFETFDIPGAFECQPATIDGFHVWKNGPGLDEAPLQAEWHGKGAVPVWFALNSEVLSVIGDGDLTKAEFESLPSLRKGTASFYHETLHPVGGHHLVSNRIQAHGALEDGTPFTVRFVLTPGTSWLDVKFN